MTNLKIFSCCHKQSDIPINEIIIPIHVGKNLPNANFNDITDSSGDNISEKNPYFCELTGMYWIWKNVKNIDFVGLCHYRRFFNLKNKNKFFTNINEVINGKYKINNSDIDNLLIKYDVILPEPVKLRKKILKNTIRIPFSVYDHYEKEHYVSDLNLLIKIINKQYPQMKEFTVKYFSKNTFYPCNMLICSKILFDEYSEWLFNILFELESTLQMNLIIRDAYQQRAYGFLSERILGLFFEYKKKTSNLKIKTVPIMFKE